MDSNFSGRVTRDTGFRHCNGSSKLFVDANVSHTKLVSSVTIFYHFSIYRHMSFSTFGLNAPLQAAIASQGYIIPTSIQTAAIPAILKGGDVLASAQTGSGKTAAFLLPLLQQLLQSPVSKPIPLRALILAPTRELAMQIAEAAQSYAVHLSTPLKIVCVVGGVSINPQMMKLRGGADMVIATPGRLLDLVEHNALHLSSVKALVLDEADRLLELGFADELTQILALLPRHRQNLLFSATMPESVVALANVLLHEPLRIAINTEVTTAPAIAQRSLVVDASKRTALLKHLLKEQQWSRVLVFVATKYSTEHVAEKLCRADVAAAALHGELSQGTRTQVLADFKESKLQVLVATDLAARGIDIIQLPTVVNYDLPRSADDYTHRIGRTARAGERGAAISFVTPESEPHFRLIEKRNNIRLPREQIAGFEVEIGDQVEDGKPAAPSNGGVKGKRKSKKDKLREAAASAQDKSISFAAPETKAKFVWPSLKRPDS
jgi:ATP-dependent RNA helicase RhlE